MKLGQFKLLRLFIVSGACAVVLAAVSPLIRSWPTAMQQRLALAAIVFGLGMIFEIVWMSLLRSQATRIAGEHIMKLALAEGSHKPYLLGHVGFMLWNLAIGSLVVYWLLFWPYEVPAYYVMVCTFLFLSAISAAQHMFMLSCGDLAYSAEVCKGGMIIKTIHVLPWAILKRHDWRSEKTVMCLTFNYHRFITVVKVAVPDELHQRLMDTISAGCTSNSTSAT